MKQTLKIAAIQVLSKVYLTLIVLVTSVLISCQQEENAPFSPTEQGYFKKALQNGKLAQEGFQRSYNYLHAWLALADSTTGLIPQNLSKNGKCIWNAHNSAADNYPFMVFTSYLLDKELYHSTMIETLKKEKAVTSRIQSLPDAYNICEGRFVDEKLDTANVIFGTSEYIKDGILPITEYMGETPWKTRMIEMLDDLSEIMRVADGIKGHFFGDSPDTEINGELLQVLSRVYWMTGDEKYLDWALEIGDYYLVNQKVNLVETERLRLRDHGCEIISGLSELYVLLHFTDKDKKQSYQEVLYALYDRVLEAGTNSDGMFYNEVNMQSGELLDTTLVDNWGYLYDAYYSVYLVDGKEEYKEAALKPLKSLKANYQHYNWENWGSDGFADAIESALNLYNREQMETTAQWMDEEIKMMWSIQDSTFRPNPEPYMGNGIIEGWHGDGNFARTSIMYAFWKTKGATVEPWNSSVSYGAEMKDDTFYCSLTSKKDWSGKLYLDTKRYKEVFQLPLDYPRINQFPEWFCIERKEKYLVSIDGVPAKEYDYDTLKKGLNITVEENASIQIKVWKVE